MIVVDASVAFKWFKSDNEDFYQESTQLLKQHLTGVKKILVPQFIFLELSNALGTKTLTSIELAKKHIKNLYSFNLEVYLPNQQDLMNSLSLAKKYKTSVYDMLYAVTAKKNKCKLITADRKFIEKTKFPHVVHISEYK
jgi:predicted nucleic acid-binding protein